MARESILRIRPVIITYSRPEWLERCVRSLVEAANRAQGVQLSIVIWINGNDTETQKISEVLSKQFANSISEITFTPHPVTPAKARNNALTHYDGDWILFIDDDAFVEPDYFSRFLDVCTDLPNAVAIGGPNLTPPLSSLFQVACGVVLSSRLGAYTSFARYKGIGERRRSNEEALILCNLFVKKSALGPSPFPETFVCNEENWLLQTIQAAGSEIIYDPKVSVLHERRPSLSLFLKQVYRYGVGRGQNTQMRPETFRVAHFIPSICTIVAAWAVGYFALFGKVIFGILSLICIYGVLCLFSSFLHYPRLNRKAALLIAPFLFPLLHVAYGMGVLFGYFSSQSMLFDVHRRLD